MITRADAEAVAGGWARREALTGGYPCEPVVEEFDLGFVVYTTRPASVRVEPGAFPKSVIDRETGRLSTWPNIPSDAVQRLYRQKRSSVVDPPKAADPAVQLRREAGRPATPSVAAHLTLDGRLFIARGAKGDQGINHHPLVAEWLAAQPAGHLVRGAERHAELLVTSDALLEVDRVRAQHGWPPVTLEDARAMCREAQFETFHIREPGDPLGGTVAEPCPSCAVALVHLSLLPQSMSSAGDAWPADIAVPPRFTVAEADPEGRFPPSVTLALVTGNWLPHMRGSMSGVIKSAMKDANKIRGLEHRLTPTPAATEFLLDFLPVLTWLKGPGTVNRIQQLAIEPTEAAWTADVLAEFGRRIGAVLYPVGTEKEQSVLAVDDRGRVFAFDQGGEWFIGEDGTAAITTLLTGGPVARVKDDGTW
jgi:hypothetical protein